MVAVSACVFASTGFCDSRRDTAQRTNDDEVAVFITGSLIPQRVKIRAVTSNTTSPLRVIDRREIDQTGRRTTPGAFINEPAVRIIGH